MTNPCFTIDVANSIFRAVINGDNPRSPAPANVIFDLFGPNYHGVIAGGNVALSAMTETVSGLVTTWQTTIPFGLTFATPPQCMWMAQYASSGAWSPMFATGNAGMSVVEGDGGGTYYATGAGCSAWGYTTTTGLILGATQIVYSGGSSSAAPPPAAWTYRVFNK